MKTTGNQKPPSKDPEDQEKVQKTIIENILKKVQRGGIPTPHEAAALKDFYAGTDPRSTKGMQEWVSSYEALGDVFGHHRSAFSRWKTIYDDCPKARADGHHSVDQWRTFFKAHPEIHGVGDITIEMQQLELEDMRQRVRKLLFNNDVREGSYTANAKFSVFIGRVVGEAKALLRQKFEHELPAYSARQEPAQIRVLNKRAIDEVCDRLAQLVDGIAI